MLTRRLWNCHYPSSRHNVRSSLRMLSFKYARDAPGYKESYIEVNPGEFEIQKYIEGAYNQLREKHVRWDLEHTSLDASVREALVPLVLKATWCTNALEYLRPQLEVVSSWHQTRCGSDGHDHSEKVLNVLNKAAQALDDTVESLTHDIAICQQEVAQELQREMYDRPVEHQEQFKRLWLPQYSDRNYDKPPRVWLPECEATTAQQKAKDTPPRQSTKSSRQKSSRKEPKTCQKQLHLDSTNDAKEKSSETSSQAAQPGGDCTQTTRSGAPVKSAKIARKKGGRISRGVKAETQKLKLDKSTSTEIGTDKKGKNKKRETSKKTRLKGTNDAKQLRSRAISFGYSWEVQEKAKETSNNPEHEFLNRLLLEAAGQEHRGITRSDKKTSIEAKLVKKFRKTQDAQCEHGSFGHITESRLKKDKVKVSHGTSDTKPKPSKGSSTGNMNESPVPGAEIHAQVATERAKPSRIGKTGIDDNITWANMPGPGVDPLSNQTLAVESNTHLVSYFGNPFVVS